MKCCKSPRLHQPLIRSLVVCLSLSLLTLITAPAMAAQNGGTVSGRVLDKAGQPLAGARVFVVGTDLTVVTGADGTYRLAGVPIGERTFVVERRGSESVAQTIQVAERDTVAIDILLPLVVLTTRVEVRADELTGAATTRGEQLIVSNAARVVDDLLRELPSVEMPRNSSLVSHPTAQGVSIRGTGRGRTLVLLDGIPLNDAFGGWVRWSRAPKSQIERTEVLRGGGSSLYGNYAMGGVVQMFSRQPTPHTLFVNVGGGSRDLFDAHLAGTHVSGPWGISLTGDIGRGGGYVTITPDQRGTIDEPATSERVNTTFQLRHAPSPSREIVFTGDYFNEDRRNGTPLTTNSREIGTFSLQGRFLSEKTGMWNANLFGSTHSFQNSNSATTPDRSSERPVLSQDIPVEDVGGSLQWSKSVGPFDLLSLGADARWIHGENRERVFGSTGAVVVRRATEGSQLISGMTGQAIKRVGRWSFDASLRFDAWNNFDAQRTITGGPTTEFDSQSNTALSPRLSVRYDVTTAIGIRGAFYRAFRAPTLNELYRGFFAGNTAFDPNPELGPERLSGGEIGIDVSPGNGLRLAAAAFLNRGSDLITFVSVSPGRRVRQNLDATRTRGFEVEFDARLHPRVLLAGNYTFLDTEILEAAAGNVVGNRIPDIPRHRGSLRLAYDNPSIVRATAIARFRDGEFDDAANRDELSGYGVLDLDFRRAILDQMGVFVTVENLFDNELITRITRGLESIGLPRTIRAGVTLNVY